MVTLLMCIYILKHEHGHHFADGFLKCISLKENCSFIEIPFKLVPKGPIDNMKLLVEVMV